MNQREYFIQCCRLLYDKGVVSGVGGNLSMRIDNRVLVTPSGYSLRDVSEGNIVTVGMEGRLVEGGTPSKDLGMHLGILGSRPEIGVVCHLHGAHIIAATTLLKPGPESLPPLTPGFVYFACPLNMLPFMVPGSVELTGAVSKHFSGSNSMALLLQNHGLITIGEDFQKAFNIAEEIEEAARIWLLTEGRANVIPPEDLEKIRKL
jgi:ribulose-5-phosphate 4-epimerase/fuculose-1-phosphate aldolase